MGNNNQELETFINNWKDETGRIKEGFVSLTEYLSSMEKCSFEFVPREGLTYSLRAQHDEQTEKPLFAMVDVIEGEPRWLSICFYAELITDAQEIGDFVPGGLLGEDALCFDMEEFSEEMMSYLKGKLMEAHGNAAS